MMRWVFFLTPLFILFASSVFAQQLRPLAVDDVEYLLQASVTPTRLTNLVNESGLKFELTDILKEKFRKKLALMLRYWARWKKRPHNVRTEASAKF